MAIALLGYSPAARAQDGPVTYAILPEASLLQVHTSAGGLLGMFGHEHDVRAHAFTGTIVYDAQDPSTSRVHVTVLTDSLLVVPAGDSSDIPAITRAMREQVLHVDRFPEITFSSTAVTVHDGTVHVRGDLTIIGRTRPVDMDLALMVTRDTLRVRGTFTIKQTAFGIRPYTTALGTIRVGNEVTFLLDIRALAVP